MINEKEKRSLGRGLPMDESGVWRWRPLDQRRAQIISCHQRKVIIRRMGRRGHTFAQILQGRIGEKNTTTNTNTAQLISCHQRGRWPIEYLPVGKWVRDGPLRKRQTDKIQSQTNTEEKKKNLYPLLRCSSAFNRRHHTWEQHSSISQSLVYLWVWVEKEKPQICVHIQCLSMTQVCVWVASAALEYFSQGRCILWYSVSLCIVVFWRLLTVQVFCGIRLVFCHRSCFSSKEHLLHAVIMNFAGLCWRWR